MQNIWAIITKSGSLWIAWIQEYVLKGKSLWDLAESFIGSWSWKKLLRLRPLAQRFVEWKNGREQWIFPREKYKATAVWEEIRLKKGKEWQRLVWTSLVVPKHAVIAWMIILNRLPTKERLMS